MTKDTEGSTTEFLEHLSQEFDALTQLRHEAGAEEYGSVTFLKAPLVRMAAEELADMANYCRYMYIRLRLIEEELNARGIDLSASSAEEVRLANEVSSDPTAFIPAEKVQGFFQGKE